MIKIGDALCEVHLACGVTDLRRGFNGLFAMIEHDLGGNPLSGKIYVFCNRKRDAIKIFFCHDHALWVCAKRLEHGTFRWPDRGDRTLTMTAEELERLLAGMDTVPRRVRDSWWNRPDAERPSSQRPHSSSQGMHGSRAV